MVLTLLCLGPGGYVAYHQQRALHQKAVVESLESHGADVYYDKTSEQPGLVRLILGDDRFGTLCILSIDGDDLVTDSDLAHLAIFPRLKSLLLHNQFGDDALAHVADCKQLTRLDLSQSRITDGGLEKLSMLTNVERLFLSRTAVTDRGISHISSLRKLEYLHLNGTLVTDRGLVEIAELQNLTELVLDDTSITDRGVSSLEGLTRLRVLSLVGTKVSNGAILQLKQSLPNATVFH